MNPQVKELLQSFETDSKAPKKKYNDFLAYVYVTFDKKISSSKADKIIEDNKILHQPIKKRNFHKQHTKSNLHKNRLNKKQQHQNNLPHKMLLHKKDHQK